jgi:L-ascorbate metabolism protein UlaG (beta-lactamase superfamily)
VRSIPALLAALSLGACSAPAYEGAPSDHFDGERFFNERPFDIGWTDLWRYYREREPGPWTRDLRPSEQPDPPRRVGEGALRVTLINHATVLLQYDGLNVLTDPIWSERASPVSWAGPRRFVAPGLRFEQLPPIDAVLVSHDHYDHLDLPTLQRLQAEHAPRFIVGLGEARWLREAGLQRVVELDWDEAHALAPGLRVIGQRCQHWTGRRPGQRNRSLWMAYLLETRGGPVYFAGDTGAGDHFRVSGERHGPMRLALLPIGAYQPRWLTEYQHLDPVQAVRAHGELGAARSLGLHFGTFQLSEEGQYQPVTDLAQARAAEGLDPEAFSAPAFGVGHDIAALSPPDPDPAR